MGRKRKRAGAGDGDGDGEEGSARVRVKGKHDKPKPWDTPDVDHWKIVPKPEQWSGLVEQSSFSTLFPQYREKYLQDVWHSVARALKEHGIKGELNLVEGSMTVTTTRKVQDPYIIIKARDLIKLLARSVPAPQALKILEDYMQCDIIKIGNLIRNKDRFVKRRQRLLGPNGATLKALELLTGCYILVQGNTVAAMGPFQGLKTLRRVVEDCIHNIHPIYHIKALMIKRELAKDPALANENWERFLPKFKKKNVQRKKSKKEKKPYTPFPPPQQPSKIDLQLESGEYFLSAETKAAKKFEEKKQQQLEKAAENKRKRDSSFVPPKETKKSERAGTSSGVSKADVTAMAQNLKEKSEKVLPKQKRIDDSVQNYLA
ncbi:hypothetical protein SELMODRAFT_268270 [Selaginella moellendorffii]|uniref:KRR1 small subunit processome component n=1 Tax=Selaginella moellendorffii TaxID=88036 RepID=D8S7Z6_SELML|nr:KRR1 small subunit processome component [Selaginella moellendorffii]EFJ19330.1 hypothetical protein SELMODRAFT_268270 [Selaginella moellendorffii]|eukprot:XP_002979441.1 KRR1 small subunit processome component [Selaginella moellendorffii]